MSPNQLVQEVPLFGVMDAAEVSLKGREHIQPAAEGQRMGEQKTGTDGIKSPRGIKTLKGGAQSGEGKQALVL